ncbi:MAG TPA: UDP-N-acetylmuramate--L-alanine ligase [Solirubrobacteraceae bacterium]|nr:UDP-N-acetylmuramate--L-alanine ligase [Solirubrobacteraceae bacterium]
MADRESSGLPTVTGVSAQASQAPRGAAQPWSGRLLHFVGIGGAGMSGLALIAHKLGAQVTGSDQSTSGYMEPLRDLGIDPIIGHAAANVPPGTEVVYSSAIAPDNPERAGAELLLHRSQLLAEIASLKRCIAVSGTHGKTTTAGMITHVLRGCGLDPAYVVGGTLRDTGLNADWGAGEWIVVEADESDRSLLNYSAEIAVLTNAELDHHSTYSSRLDLDETFARFTAGADMAVVWDRPELVRIAAGSARVVPYDATDLQPTTEGIRFQWQGRRVALSVLGAHNAVNAAGALTASALAGAESARAIVAIASFHGARRRQELLGTTYDGVPIYDEYAHHPTEVAAAIAGAREFGASRLVAVFQPHLYSRTRALARDFGTALATADACAVVDVYPARERAEDFPGVDGRLIAAAAADAGGGRTTAWMPKLDDAKHWLEATLRPGDLCLVMGAGNIDSLGRALAARGA